MGGSQTLGEVVDAIEVLPLLLVVIGHVDVVGRRQFREVDVDEVRVVDQVWHQLEQFVQLGLGQVPVYAVGTKATAELCLKVLRHKGRQVGNVRPLQATQEMPEAIGVEHPVLQVLESAIRNAL